MARRRKGKKVLILILLATGLFYVNFKKEIFSYLTNIFSAEKKDINNNAENKPKLTGMTEKELVKNVEETDIRKKEIDFNGDGKKEIFITTFANSGAKAAIGNKDGNLLTPVFNFDVRAFPEIEFKIEDVPEISEIKDLNGDGLDEFILDLKSYGAYSNLFGIIEVNDSKFSWAMIKTMEGKILPAIFYDGASVRNANIFRIYEDGSKKAIVYIAGNSSDGENWFWEGEVYSWSGGEYKYDVALTRKILSEQPRKMINGEPVF